MMTFKKKFIVMGVIAVSLVGLIAAGLFFSEAGREKGKAGVTLVATDQKVTIDGRCMPAIIIETMQGDPENKVSDMYKECTEQATQKTCLKVDRFHYNKGTWQPDGQPDCQWSEN